MRLMAEKTGAGRLCKQALGGGGGLAEMLSLVCQAVRQETGLCAGPSCPLLPGPRELSLAPSATDEAVNIPPAPGHHWGPGDTRDEK